MSVFDTIADNAFTPYRGTEEAIQQFPIRDGAVYFAYDTKKIYFDMDDVRHSMGGGDSIHFVYGNAESTDILQDADTLYWKFPIEMIEGDHYLVDDIIINQNGTFYRIKAIGLTYVFCTKLLVAGSGSGSGGSGGGSDNGLSITCLLYPENVIPYGSAVDCVVKVFDTKQTARQATLTISYYADIESVAPAYTDSSIIATIDTECPITLNQKYLQSGFNYISISASAGVGANKRSTAAIEFQFTYLNITFSPTTQWTPATLFNAADSGFSAIFPYQVQAGDNASKTYLENNFKATITYDINDGVFGSGKEEIQKISGSIPLTDLFKLLSQGDYTFHIKAVYTLNGVDVNIGEYSYGICIYQKTNDDPIIWSSFDTKEIENYSNIIIDYNVYDPLNNGNATVEYYINGEYLRSDDVTYVPGQWISWNIPEYIVGDNTFTIVCRGVEKTFEVTVVRNDSLNLDAIDGAVIYLTPKGRSNTEKLSLRKKWTNKATGDQSNLNIGEVQLSGFNWANNGWMSEVDANTGNEVNFLRITNGASVKIPIQLMQTDSANSATYEFDFRVRNAVNYNRLINEIPGATAEDPTTTELVPTAGAFLQYFNFDNNKGILLGTQEAVFALGKTSLASVRYVDTDATKQDHVKISIVVDSDGTLTPICGENGVPTGDNLKLVYMYINGVLSSIYKHTGSGFDAKVSSIDIVSDYCDVDLFSIRVYRSALGYADITQNWVGDALSLDEKKSRYAVNQKLVNQSTGDLSYEAVKSAGIIPTMVLTTYDVDGVGSADNRLPYFKGNKKVVGVRFYDPADPTHNFHAQNVELNVQGTSSQGYPRRNYKLKLKQMIDSTTTPQWTTPFYSEDWDGVESNRDFWYGANKGATIGGTLITDDVISEHTRKKVDIGNGIAVKEFCLKADYMESSSTHNTAFAMLVGQVMSETYSGSLDLRHPLNRDFGLSKTYRTTIYGFPMLLFWEDADGNIEYVGKYNFNIDKGATDAFGFSEESVNEYSPVIVHHGEEEARHSTFEEIAECWEFTQNQVGLGKFTCTPGYTFDTEGQDGADIKSFGIYAHFEPRYLKDAEGNDVDFEDYLEDESTAKDKMREAAKNLKVMWTWVNSTDTNSATNDDLDTPVYYKTLSTAPEKGITYYSADTTDESNETPVTITTDLQYRQSVETGESSLVRVKDSNTFKNLLLTIIYPSEEDKDSSDLSRAIGPCSFIKNADGNYVYIKDDVEYLATDYGIAVDSSFSKDTFTILVEYKYEGFSASVKEKFTTDSIRYRKAKFKNELTQHLDLNYMLMYFVLTEVVLAYDSRQKNMMIATWGPRAEGGDYIWYPIFYDIDTQLGVNNSGYQTWDYDTDATQVIEDAEGKYQDSSVFAGAGSVLWMNFWMLFKSEILNAYDAMREKETISSGTLESYYNTKGSNKWSEVMKNLDSYFKYIAPACTGYTDQSGEWKLTQECFYCLQGDRELLRKGFFRNRMNYLDSSWQKGDYYASATRGSQIKMRYNANMTDGSTSETVVKPDLSFTVTPYLSQYVSILFDETATTPVLYKSGNEPVVAEPPTTISSRLDEKTPLSQQLVYIRGPQYLSDIGDLSPKYINEFSYGAATRLRRLKLGSMKDGYKNNKFTTRESLTSTTSNSPKGLMVEMDVSNLAKLDGELEIPGCTKLETFKALGSSLEKVEFTEGNVLKTVFMPKTITDFRLLQPLALTNILEKKPVYNEDEVYEEGLYIENFTDKLDSEITDDSNCNINVFKITQSKLGIDSYRMLKYLYNYKEKTQGELKFDLTEVEWSPYTQVESGSSVVSGTSYYKLIDGVTYETYSYNTNLWDDDVADGIIYTKDTSFNTDALTDLDMFEHFVEMYVDGSYNNVNQNYRYKSVYSDSGDQNKKIIPEISGVMHVNGTEPIDEYTVYEWTTKYWPNLTITADNVISAPSAHFIEYTEDGCETLAWLKYPTSTSESDKAVVKYIEEEPSRRHYDFLGWAIVTSGNQSILRSQNSVITEEQKATVGTLYSTEELEKINLMSYASSNYKLTFCAVYEVHGYNMYFYNGNDLIDTVIVPAGTKVQETTKIPSRDSSSFANMYLCWKFNGWSTNNNDDGEDVQDITRITASDNMNFYAKFIESNVYNNVIPASAIGYQLVNGKAAIYLKEEAGLSGKICIPAMIDGYPVGSIADWSSIASSEQETNGFYDSLKITHIFFQGCEDNPEVDCQISSFGTSAFANMSNLIHIDIPASLKVIGNNCFGYDEKLETLTDLQNVVQLGMGSLDHAGCGTGTLTMRGDIYINSSNFSTDVGWEEIRIGTKAIPMTVAYTGYYNSELFYKTEDSIHGFNTGLLRIIFLCDDPVAVEEKMAKNSASDDYYAFCSNVSQVQSSKNNQIKVEFISA